MSEPLTNLLCVYFNSKATRNTTKTPSFPRRRESSDFIQNAFRLCPRFGGRFFICWIPACAGMTGSKEWP